MASPRSGRPLEAGFGSAGSPRNGGRTFNPNATTGTPVFRRDPQSKDAGTRDAASADPDPAVWRGKKRSSRWRRIWADFQWDQSRYATALAVHQVGCRKRRVAIWSARHDGRRSRNPVAGQSRPQTALHRTTRQPRHLDVDRLLR